MIIIYLSCFLLVLYYLYTKNYDYWKSKGVPYEKPFLFFGNFYQVAMRKQHLFHRVREIYDKYKTPYIGIYIFNQPNLIIRSTDMLKKILVKDSDKFINRQVATNEAVDPIATHNMFSAQDQNWKNLRTKVSPVFTSGKIKLMFPLIKHCALDLNEYLQKHNGEIIEGRIVLKKYAVDIISSCAFGIDAHCLKNDKSEIMDVAKKLTDSTSLTRSFSIFSYFFAHKLVDIFRLTFLDKPSTDYLCNIFKNTYEERKKKQIVRNDLIGLLNELKDNTTLAETYQFDDIKMAAQAIVFFSAGSDTTAMTVAYTLYELALNHTIQDRLRQEIKETFEKDGDFTYELVQEMKYLDIVLNETLRKYPLTIFLSRKSASEYTFEETGLTLEKDSSILIPVAGLHFDPEYFPDPEKFDPERFSDNNKANIKPYTYLPFGDGPRNCIGQRFGVLVSKLALIYALKDFVFNTTEYTPIPLIYDPASMFLECSQLYMKAIKI